MITVKDSDVPVILCPSNPVEVCTDTGLCTWMSDEQIYPNYANENCPGVSVSYTITGVTSGSGTGSVQSMAFALGSSTIEYIISDGSGNMDTCTFEVIVSDCEAPVISCPVTTTVECDGLGNTDALATWLATVSAADNCDADPTITNMIFATIPSCGTGSTTIYQFTATDDAGNTSICTASFIIEDTTPPLIDVEAVPDFAECSLDYDFQQFFGWLVNNGNAVASDICGDPISWTNDFDGTTIPGSCGETESIAVIFTATDACGNSSTTQAIYTFRRLGSPFNFLPN